MAKMNPGPQHSGLQIPSTLPLFMTLAIVYSIMATAITWTTTFTLKTKRIPRWCKILVIDIITIATFIFLFIPLDLVFGGLAIRYWYWTLNVWVTERLYCAVIIVALTWLIAFMRYVAKGFVDWLKSARAGKAGWLNCPFCGVKVKSKNLNEHIAKVHPNRKLSKPID